MREQRPSLFAAYSFARTMSTDENNCGLDTQLLANFLKKRFHDKKPAEIISVEVNNAVPKGENYATLVYRVEMSCLTAAGRKKKFSIIVKRDLKALNNSPLIRLEIKYYTTVLSMMEELMDEFGDRREKLWPDLLGSQHNQIAFGDLSDEGYVGVERRKGLDANHSKLVLRNLARIHAMSKVLLERGLMMSTDAGQLGIALDFPFMNTWYGSMMTVLSDAMESQWGNEWAEIAKKVKGHVGVHSTEVQPLAKEYDHRFDVFNHGDLWTCNLLFNYMDGDDNFPISVKIIDYQACHVNSFIWDLLYFITISTIPGVRRSQLDELFEAYQLSLGKNLIFFNYAGYIPTLDDVKSEWKRVEFAQMLYCLLQPIVTAESTTAFDIEKLMTHPPNEVFEESVYADGKALEAIGEELKNLAIIGLI